MLSCGHHDGMAGSLQSTRGRKYFVPGFCFRSLLSKDHLPTGILLAVTRYNPGPVLCWAARPTMEAFPRVERPRGEQG